MEGQPDLVFNSTLGSTFLWPLPCESDGRIALHSSSITYFYLFISQKRRSTQVCVHLRMLSSIYKPLQAEDFLSRTQQLHAHNHSNCFYSGRSWSIMDGVQTFHRYVMYRSPPRPAGDIVVTWCVRPSFRTTVRIFIITSASGGFSGMTTRDGWNYMDKLSESFGGVVRLRDIFGVRFTYRCRSD